MKCERCQGFGRIPITNHPRETYRLEPCPDCNGRGTKSCCGDSVAQPNKDAEARRRMGRRR
jgi:DnaJ-class molecular chaperone